MEKQTDFRIRSYGRTELAQLYNPCLTPKAAYRKLVGWIDHYPGLAVRLPETGRVDRPLSRPRRPPCRAWQAARFAFLHPCPGAGDRRGARRTVTHSFRGG